MPGTGGRPSSSDRASDRPKPVMAVPADAVILSSREYRSNHAAKSGSGRMSPMDREIVHVGRKIRVAIDTQTTPDGQTIRRDVILHPGAVVILPVLDAEHVVLLRNHR